MVDLKDWDSPRELHKNLSKCKGIINIVRFAVNPKKIIETKDFLKVIIPVVIILKIKLIYT